MPMLEGEISEIQLVERLVELWREEFTGAIRFENDGIIKIVYFKNGDVLSASTNDRSDSIDEILMRAGKVSREHVKQALAKRKENETLGDALLNLGFITRKELTWARRVQVVGVIRSISVWTSGSFTIVADYLPKRDEGTLFPLPQILVELIVTDPDRQHFERALEGGRAIYARAKDFDTVFQRLGLNEDADAIVAQVDGTRSAAEVAAASGRDTFNVYKLLHALATLGILTRSTESAEASQFSIDDFASAGVADAADMWGEPATPTSTPVVATPPQFELDDVPAHPTLEVPATAPLSAWDEEPEPPAPPAATTAKMPAWDLPPRAAAPVPAPIEPPVEPQEEQWGFDEAQIETAQRGAAPTAAATTPLSRSPLSTPLPKRGKSGSSSRLGLIIALMVVFILAGAGYFGFRWWQDRQAAEEAANVVVRPVRKPPVIPAPEAQPPAQATIAPVTETIAEATTTTAAPTTTSAPAPAPARVAATAPPPAASETNALPPVVARSTAVSGRERYDAMAREYLANPTGKFTIQIQILCEPSNLQKVMNAGSGNVWFVPQTIGSRSCYRVFWGRYATRDEAQRALASVPASVRDRSAAVKPVPRG